MMGVIKLVAKSLVWVTIYQAITQFASIWIWSDRVTGLKMYWIIWMMNLFYIILPLALFLVLLYFIIHFLISKQLPLILICLVVFIFYIMYGITLYGGQFWRIGDWNDPRESFLSLLQSEAKDFHLSTAILLGVVFITFTSLKASLQSTRKMKP
jgi:hypothetical protein